jgi:hypothetical protein
MPTTAVGLFEDPRIAEDVVREIEGLGFPRNEIRILDEPATFEVTGVMSFARLDFEVDLLRELTRIGATRAEAEAHIEGLRRGGALVLATGSGEKVDIAAAVMNRRGAVEIEETRGPEPNLPHVFRENAIRTAGSSVMAGRIRQPGGGACLFVW